MRLTLTILAALLLLGCCGRCARGETLSGARADSIKADTGDVLNMGNGYVHFFEAVFHAASVAEIPEGTETVEITKQADTFLRRFQARLKKVKSARDVEATAARIIPATATVESRQNYLDVLAAIKAGRAVEVSER